MTNAEIKEALDILAFHEERIRELGQREDGNPRHEKRGWSIRQTAKHYGMSKSRCHNLIILAKALKKSSQLKYSTYSAALRLARKMVMNA